MIPFEKRRELKALGAQFDGVARSIARLTDRIYALDLNRGRQADALKLIRRNLNHATRYKRDALPSLEESLINIGANINDD
jgi:hypothetical protein